MAQEAQETACSHPVTRQFAWHAYDETLVICCCDCGDVLRGGADEKNTPRVRGRSSTGAGLCRDEGSRL